MRNKISVADKTISALKRAEISSHDAARIVAAVLEGREHLQPEDIALCTGMLIDILRAVPLRDTITTDESTGQMSIRGKPVKDAETQKKIVDGAAQMLRNTTRALVREKVEFEAHVIGVRRSTELWDIVFAKAAIWFMQEEDKLYARIAGHLGTSSEEE